MLQPARQTNTTAISQRRVKSTAPIPEKEKAADCSREPGAQQEECRLTRVEGEVCDAEHDFRYNEMLMSPTPVIFI